jgi:SAM-dependent methyltransferase
MAKPRDKLAFGVEPARRHYYMRLARYDALGEAVAAHAAARGDVTQPLDLLDVGPGSGRTMRFLDARELAGRVRYVGVDVSDRRLASVYAPQRWALVRADAQRGLPLADASFDVVVCEQVLEHLTNPAFVVGEIARVLRPGGLAVLGVPSFPRGVDLVRRHVVPGVDRLLGKSRDHLQTFTLARFRRLVEATGLFDVRAARGFRVVADGIVSPLEDFQWWWRLNRRVGRIVPWLCIEVQIVAVRKQNR